MKNKKAHLGSRREKFSLSFVVMNINFSNLFRVLQKVNHSRPRRVSQPQQHQLLIQIQVHRRAIKTSLHAKCVEIKLQVIKKE
jgi:hypothetical protein